MGRYPLHHLSSGSRKGAGQQAFPLVQGPRGAPSHCGTICRRLVTVTPYHAYGSRRLIYHCYYSPPGIGCQGRVLADESRSQGYQGISTYLCVRGSLKRSNWILVRPQTSCRRKMSPFTDCVFLAAYSSQPLSTNLASLRW